MSRYTFDPKPYLEQIKLILLAIQNEVEWKPRSLRQILAQYPKDGVGMFSFDQLIAGYEELKKSNLFEVNSTLEDRIKMKPTRTISGVAPVTVLTKPFPCPGKCIFCPNDVRMPKSYLRDEPGAQRAEMNSFDPYLQTFNRLLALQKTGHNVEKVELIVLGGTWSYYPESYQIWFIKRCFEAMNDFGVKDARDEIKRTNIFENAYSSEEIIDAQKEKETYNQLIAKIASKDPDGLIHANEKSTWEELEKQHEFNENAISKCVGLVLETRPDCIDEAEVIRLRKLGATKIQIGIQSLDDKIMELNKRGHTHVQTSDAIKLLRTAGFKIHGHWMPNLYGSSVKKDIEDYKKLWLPDISPDELKIYPTSIIANTELFDKYKSGDYKPYDYSELLEVLTETLPTTPRYCRLTRIIRDIPSTDIVAGNKLTNFRQIAEDQIHKDGKKCECIRCREIKGVSVHFDDLEMEVLTYQTISSVEYFISYKTKSHFNNDGIPGDKIVGFLRLSLPKAPEANFIDELRDRAIIREVHVYGNVAGLGHHDMGKSQHIGIGTLLISKAKEIAKTDGFDEISVISAIGTREYYRKKGFSKGNLYMWSEC